MPGVAVPPWATETVLSPWLAADEVRVWHVLSHVVWWKKKKALDLVRSIPIKILRSYIFRKDKCKAIYLTNKTYRFKNKKKKKQKEKSKKIYSKAFENLADVQNYMKLSGYLFPEIDIFVRTR